MARNTKTERLSTEELIAEAGAIDAEAMEAIKNYEAAVRQANRFASGAHFSGSSDATSIIHLDAGAVNSSNEFSSTLNQQRPSE